MYLKFSAALLLMQISIGTAFAVDDKKATNSQPGGLLQGTSEEQGACASDSTKFCRDFFLILFVCWLACRNIANSSERFV
jgi:hypothetical protein